jgi:WD40 repeat protein
MMSAAFSPDGSRVVTTFEDGMVQVWRADGQGEPFVLQAYGAVGARSAAFSPDGSRVVTAHEDGSARIWLLSIDGLRQQLRNANHNCMPPGMRQTYLGEQEEESRKGHEACERSYGRAPRLPLPR